MYEVAPAWVGSPPPFWKASVLLCQEKCPPKRPRRSSLGTEQNRRLFHEATVPATPRLAGNSSRSCFDSQGPVFHTAPQQTRGSLTSLPEADWLSSRLVKVVSKARPPSKARLAAARPLLPSIAQLAERRTVGVPKQSLGRWFDSGSKDECFSLEFAPAVPVSILFWSRQRLCDLSCRQALHSSCLKDPNNRAGALLPCNLHWQAWLQSEDTYGSPRRQPVFEKGSRPVPEALSCALAGNRTRVNCLEGSYAHHYTTNATLALRACRSLAAALSPPDKRAK
ncbi:unnamed protein product, partial [Protopolystoma xenopodis]